MALRFRSDSSAGIASSVLAALAAANTPDAALFGGDDVSQRLAQRLSEIFERRVWAFPVVPGTAANAIGLATLAAPGRAILCHETAHIFDSEVGAVEFYAAGARLTPVAARDGKLLPEAVAAALKAPDNPRGVGLPVAAVAVTQLTEWGTAYTPDELGAIAQLAHDHGALVHMDGARIANAVAALGCAPADITWRAGVDVLSFGGTKNGAMGADAIVVFEASRAAAVAERARRAGHRAAKLRYVAAQLDALCAGDTWLSHARHANSAAQRLAAGLLSIPGVEITRPPDGNLVFARLPEAVLARLRAAGIELWQWHTEPGHDAVYRLVTAFNTRMADVDQLIAAASAQHASAAAG
jgi:threonine aldolase